MLLFSIFKRSKLTSTIALSAMLFFSSLGTAHAEESTMIFIFTPGLTTTTTTGVALSAVDMVSSTTSSTSDSLFGDCAQAEVYLNNNVHALEQDISMGAGESISDLGHMAGIRSADINAFAKLLRAHRSELLPLLGGERVDADATREFAQLIEDAMKQDAELARYVDS